MKISLKKLFNLLQQMNRNKLKIKQQKREKIIGKYKIKHILENGTLKEVKITQ